MFKSLRIGYYVALCYPQYYNFLMYLTLDLETDAQMQTTMYELIQRFPKVNRELLERLIVHLSR